MAGSNFMRYKASHPHLDYRVIMPLHDAIYLEVWWEHLQEVMETAVPYCMVEHAYAPSIDLRLGIDIETMFHFGHKVKPQEAIAESLAHLVAGRH